MINIKNLKTISILLIQKNLDSSKRTLTMLGSVFEHIYTAKDANEALKIYKENNIDIILMDIEIKQDIYAIKTLKEISSYVPILAFVYPSDICACIELYDDEIYSFVIKPLNTYKLLNKINKLAQIIINKNELAAKEKIIDENLIYSQTDTKGIITYVSKPFIEISGFSKEELIGKAHNIVRHPDVDSLVFKDLWTTIKSGKTWHGEIKNRKKNGDYYLVKTVVSPIYNKNKIVAYGSARLDITLLEKKSKDLHFNSKYKAMTEMLSMVSHHWRQPLASIGLIADNTLFDITMEESTTESIASSLKEIKGQVKSLSNTLDTFKSFLKKSSKQRVSIDEIIKNTIFVVDGILQENNITLNIINNFQDKTISTYQNELINILVSIIINAKESIVNSSIENGYITITIAKIDKNTLEIIILDNGGGIDSKIKDRIFEPYISTKSLKNGTGLGLYIVKELVEKKLNGNIFAQNVNNGAEFKLNIQGVING
nr:PAS domain-containing protein [uncultured Sulfurimonas sp.]